MLRSLFRNVAHVLVGCCVFASAASADEASDINAMFRAGQTTEALARLDKLLEARPKDAPLRFLKGVLLSDSQRRSDAAAVFQQLSVDYPELPEPYNNLAVIYAAQGDYDKARAALEAALRAQPGYAVAHQNLGDVYVQLARQSYSQALKLDPSNTTLAPKLALLRELTKPVTSTSAKSPPP